MQQEYESRPATRKQPHTTLTMATQTSRSRGKAFLTASPVDRAGRCRLITTHIATHQHDPPNKDSRGQRAPGLKRVKSVDGNAQSSQAHPGNSLGLQVAGRALRFTRQNLIRRPLSDVEKVSKDPADSWCGEEAQQSTVGSII